MLHGGGGGGGRREDAGGGGGQGEGEGKAAGGDPGWGACVFGCVLDLILGSASSRMCVFSAAAAAL